MARLTIDLPPDLDERLQARTAEAGFGSAQEYVRALIEADFDPSPDYGAPPDLCCHNDAELEAMLLEAINSGPGETFPHEEWKELRAELRRDFEKPDAHV